MAYGDEIGLHRAIVRIVPYHPKWAEYFRREKELLLKMMGETVLDIRHIGSTSIVGMPAKPILDILVAVQTLAAVFYEWFNMRAGHWETLPKALVLMSRIALQHRGAFQGSRERIRALSRKCRSAHRSSDDGSSSLPRLLQNLLPGSSPLPLSS